MIHGSVIAALLGFALIAYLVRRRKATAFASLVADDLAPRRAAKKRKARK